MERVSFISNEDGDDLIVSFAVPDEEFISVKSLTLLRTPKYEVLLPEEDLGVSVSFDDYPDDENDRLIEIEWKGKDIRIVTERHKYLLDVARVDDDEIGEAQRILKKMNFDNRFLVNIVQ